MRNSDMTMSGTSNRALAAMSRSRSVLRDAGMAKASRKGDMHESATMSAISRLHDGMMVSSHGSRYLSVINIIAMMTLEYSSMRHK